MIGLLTSFLPSLFNIGGKMIEDKDKKNEYAFKVLEMSNQVILALVNTKTVPWVDALVKLSYAGDAIIKSLFTPVLTAVGFGFGLYFELNHIEVSTTVEMILFGSFPAWRVARQKEKNAKIALDKQKVKAGIAFEDDED